jgi:Rv2525c-like, glycoside hydrolase-like domain
MALNAKVTPAASGLIGWDTNAKVSAAVAKDFRSKGFSFCMRYLTRARGNENPGDLTEAEAATILQAGLWLGAVQHVAPEGWSATAALGAQYGANAAANARAIGLPAGLNLWLDLEGVSNTSSHQDVIDYCNNWFSAVDGAGYVSGVYVGANAVLTGDELFLRLRTMHYWRSGSSVPDIPHRGYQLIQHIAEIDRDVTRTDNLGGAALLLQPD